MPPFRTYGHHLPDATKHLKDSAIRTFNLCITLKSTQNVSQNLCSTCLLYAIPHRHPNSEDSFFHTKTNFAATYKIYGEEKSTMKKWEDVKCYNQYERFNESAYNLPRKLLGIK